ncbi:MAG: hypothetical protein MJ252_15000, partial [archaeon]|nr:hypothetical protein [archaeon]
NKISTFDYLLHINFYSCRSFNDTNQYPVFPWLSTIDEKEHFFPRDFRYPVSVQSDEKREAAINKAKLNYEATGFMNVFNSHYSTSAFVLFYMFRLSPFTQGMISLQNGRFDNPNRLFHSIFEVLRLLQKYSDNRELIPEIYYLPEIYVNHNFSVFGTRNSDGKNVFNGEFLTYYDNNKLIHFRRSNSPVEFICRIQRLLESNKIKENINKWIDWIFGDKQLSQSDECCNIFPKYTYEEKNEFERKMKKMKEVKNKTDKEIFKKIRDRISIVINLGQTPQKLFFSPHPKYRPEKIRRRSYSYENLKEATKEKKNAVYDIMNHSILKQEILMFNFKTVELSKKEISKFYYVITNDKKFYMFEKKLKVNGEYIQNSPIEMKELPLAKKMSYGYYKYYLVKKKGDISKHYYNFANSTFFTLANSNFVVLSNHTDKTIMFYHIVSPGTYSKDKLSEKHLVTELRTNSFITSIVKINNNNFIAGDDKGKLTHYFISYDDKKIFSISQIKSVYTQRSEILCLSYDNTFNIIMTGDKFGYVSIRSYNNFELLSSFKVSKNNKDDQFPICDIKINRSNNLLYILAYNMKKGKYILFGYTVNGMKFSYLEDIAGNFQILKNGKIMCYSQLTKSKAFIVVRPECLSKYLVEFACEFEDTIERFIFDEEEMKIFYFVSKIKKNKKRVLLLKEKKLEAIEAHEIYKEDILYTDRQSIWDDLNYDNDVPFGEVDAGSTIKSVGEGM